MGKNEEWLERDKNALASVLPRCSDIVAMRGKGTWLYDVEWNKYLDFTSGIAANSTGHCHPKIVDAIKLQADTLIHTSVTTHHRMNIRLAERLGEICTFFEEPQVFFCNSGAEAVDGALKLAQVVTGKSGVVAFRGAFHGRTVGATSLTTAKNKYRDPYIAGLLSGIRFVDYGSEVFTGVYPGWIGMMIVEPILGEGGYVVPPEGWLQYLREYCDENNILLVFDEVQTGIGRTGHWFAAETFGVTPDVILFAKGIASGLPLGGIIAPRLLLDQWPEGTHGSTFGGNPVSCAAALATLEILEPLLPRVKEKGYWALEKLEQWSPRGIGYMIGIPCINKQRAINVQDFCRENGLLVLLCGPEEDTIRLIPPLTASDEEWEIAMDILDRALNKCLIDDILKYSW